MKIVRLLDDQLINVPIFVRVIRQISSDNHRYLTITQLFHGDLQRISFTGNIDHHWRIHANLQCASSKHSCAFILGHVASGNSLTLVNWLSSTSIQYFDSVLAILLVQLRKKGRSEYPISGTLATTKLLHPLEFHHRRNPDQTLPPRISRGPPHHRYLLHQPLC